MWLVDRRGGDGETVRDWLREGPRGLDRGCAEREGGPWGAQRELAGLAHRLQRREE